MAKNSKDIDYDYDYLIVGAGPAGLTLAWILSQYQKKVLLIDQEADVGGCHRVRRAGPDGQMFTEHGPRIYLDNYLTFQRILEEIGTNWDELFTPYKFNLANVGGQSVSNFKAREIAWIAWEYIRLIFNPSYSKSVTIREVMQNRNFTESTQSYIDRLCRLTDGAGADRYTLYQFLQLANQNAFYSIYQPRRANDKGLFKIWREALLKTNQVDLWLENEAVQLLTKTLAPTSTTTKNQSNSQTITGVVIRDLPTGHYQTVRAKNVVLAIPPWALYRLLENAQQPSIPNAFGPAQKLLDWVRDTEYNTYIPITFHWDRKLQLPEIWGFPKTDWGVAYIILSDYMKFDHPDSKTVISACITMVDNPIKNTQNHNNQSHEQNQNQNKNKNKNKTANQVTSKEELIQETLRQLRESYPDLPQPTHSLLSPGIYRDTDEQPHRWMTQDDSFFLTPAGYLKATSPIFSNLYNLGTHNGHSQYDFTSLESSSSNAFALAHQLEPAAKTDYPISQLTTPIRWIRGLLFLFLVWIAWRVILPNIF